MGLEVARLERLPLRTVWKHEAYDFTTWLEENIDILNEVIDLNLVSVEREQSAGTFSIDLVAEEENGGTVIIENQLEKSDHDHLGKLLTYLTAMSAKAAIWIVAEPRIEHVNAVNWLNESSNADFYMLKIEAIRIDNSKVAPLFTLIVGPSEQAKEVGKTKKNIAERYSIRKQWWTELIEKSASITKLHSHVTPGEYSWIGVSAGLRGLGYNYTVKQTHCGIELYIDRGKESEEENYLIFDELYKNKDEIENKFGSQLTWQRLEGKRACRIRYLIEDGGYRTSEEHWGEIQIKQIKAMNNLEQALKPHIQKLKKDV